MRRGLGLIGFSFPDGLQGRQHFGARERLGEDRRRLAGFEEDVERDAGAAVFAELLRDDLVLLGPVGLEHHHAGG